MDKCKECKTELIDSLCPNPNCVRYYDKENLEDD